MKDVLSDQSVLAGVGNIYANDGLWRARILPTKKANELSKKDASKLLSALCDVMSAGLKTGGASDNTFRDLHGKRGAY